MEGINLRVSQVQKQSQIQTLNQRQIQSLEILSMGSDELRERIFLEAQKNPALEIVFDPLENAEGQSDFKERVLKTKNEGLERYAAVTASQNEASDNFQAVIESAADERETLQDHLKKELSLQNIKEENRVLCELLIGNLEEHGHHILAPESLSPLFLGEKGREKLEECLNIVQNLDPAGCGVKDVWESLLVQAKSAGNAPYALIFLLDGHSDMLNPPQSAKILKKISIYREGILKLFALPPSEMEKLEKTKSFTEQDIESAISFMKTLDPNPASAFLSEPSIFIEADVKVEKEKDEEGNSVFNISLCRSNLPEVKITSDYSAENGVFAKNTIKEAKAFLNEIAFRESTLLSAVKEIVKAQKAFFEKGPRYLCPLKQKDVAQIIGVHEATVSRMATKKYLECEWGLFEIGYFFTNQVGEDSSTSQIGVKAEIEQILKEHSNDKKKLSDQKIADILKERGIKIARRTVAKYRAAMNINSSYAR